jgi:hypothetical protein
MNDGSEPSMTSRNFAGWPHTISIVSTAAMHTPLPKRGHYPALRVDRIMSVLPPNADIGSAFRGWSYQRR